MYFYKKIYIVLYMLFLVTKLKYVDKHLLSVVLYYTLNWLIYLNI